MDTITFKCTGAAGEAAKTATTTDTTAVLEADFYRAGDANDESFTAFMTVSETDIADDIAGVSEPVDPGTGLRHRIVHFRH